MVLLPKKLLSIIVVNADIIWFREKNLHIIMDKDIVINQSNEGYWPLINQYFYNGFLLIQICNILIKRHLTQLLDFLFFLKELMSNITLKISSITIQTRPLQCQTQHVSCCRYTFSRPKMSASILAYVSACN